MSHSSNVRDRGHSVTRGFSIERGSNYVLVDVCSYVDSASAEAFRSVLRTCNESAVPFFIVDLSSCRYIDSTGLGMLVTHHRNHENLIVIVPDGTSFLHPKIPSSLASHLNFVPSREAALEMTRTQDTGGTAARSCGNQSP